MMATIVKVVIVLPLCRCCESVLYQVRPPPSSLPLASFNAFGQCLAVILGQCLASALHRCHVITIHTEPLVLVGRLERVESAEVLNRNQQYRNHDQCECGQCDQCVDDGGCHCVALVCVVCVYCVKYARRCQP